MNARGKTIKMEDTIKLPLDADGVPIRPGDVVYKNEDPKPLKVCYLTYTGIGLTPWNVEVLGDNLPFIPKCFSHNKPDSLEDIEKDLFALVGKARYEYREDRTDDVKAIMERIKKMVER